MIQKRLRAYFTVPTRRVELLLAVGAVWLLLLFLLAPGSAGYQELHRRGTAVFVEGLGVRAAPFDVIFQMGYIVFFILAPIVWTGMGVIALRQRALIRDFSDTEADAVLSARMLQLPAILEERLGLPPLGAADGLLVLWGPRPKDRALMHPLGRQGRKRLRTAPGRFAVGSDGKVRFARLHVLVIEKRGAALYFLNGFYSLIHQQFSGETWGVYRLAQAKRVKTNPDDCRVALLMDDGKQFVVNLLTAQEGERLSPATAYPRVVFPEAGERLQQFCEIQQAMVVTTVVPPIISPSPTPAPDPVGAPAIQAQPAAQAEDDAGLMALEARLRAMCHGDAALMERLVTQAGGPTRAEAVDEAIRRLERDNQLT